ncbi:endolytic transglycosylase MltG [Parafilimonas sp.]|uniref:endolytic transglycosylase MltG n=1 Tax=Parafilimonas sp. TaxID=1969739 RepID=UPI0039E23FAF
MKRILGIAALVILLLALITAWLVFGPATIFSNKIKYIYVRDGIDAQAQIEKQLDTGYTVRTVFVFKLLARPAKAFSRITPGRFEIKKGESIFNILRTLRNNHQSPVRLVINKLRIPQDLAKIIGKNFSTDSLQALLFLTNTDSLQTAGVDTNTLMTIIIPDTYFLNWNTSTKKILLRLKDEQDNFWDKDGRLQKAEALNLTKLQVYTLASIVEEETNKNDEKGNIASVYINRLNSGMPLAADPTIKFALKNFALKRIYYGQLNTESPYNTYRNKGLPPGPICTPSPATIDAVLNAPKTDYLFFVAKSDFSGYHQFTSNFAEHEKYAKLYQQALNEEIAKRQLDSLNKTLQH